MSCGMQLGGSVGWAMALRKGVRLMGLVARAGSMAQLLVRHKAPTAAQLKGWAVRGQAGLVGGKTKVTLTSGS
jgi:hypothetical protein